MFAGRTKKWARMLVVLALVTVVGAACKDSVPATTGSSTTATTTVAVSAGDWFFTPDPATVPAGDVTFVVANKGPAAHEMIVVQTNMRPSQLPTAEGGGVDLRGFPSWVDASDIPAGGQSSLTVPLKPGKYLLLCNLPGHFQHGMYASFNVTR